MKSQNVLKTDDFQEVLDHLNQENNELKEVNQSLLYQLQYSSLQAACCNNFVVNLLEKLETMHDRIPCEYSSYRMNINSCICWLKQYLNRSVWDEFRLRFAEIHTDFYDNLKKQYPALTENDMRLCAFIKLKMSTKEIAATLHQEVNSVKVARKRLREKLQMNDASVSLMDQMALF
jgi:DNA-binding CsgD family transcriptional regulator